MESISVGAECSTSTDEEWFSDCLHKLEGVVCMHQPEVRMDIRLEDACEMGRI